MHSLFPALYSQRPPQQQRYWRAASRGSGHLPLIFLPQSRLFPENAAATSWRSHHDPASIIDAIDLSGCFVRRRGHETVRRFSSRPRRKVVSRLPIIASVTGAGFEESRRPAAFDVIDRFFPGSRPRQEIPAPPASCDGFSIWETPHIEGRPKIQTCFGLSADRSPPLSRSVFFRLASGRTLRAEAAHPQLSANRGHRCHLNPVVFNAFRGEFIGPVLKASAAPCTRPPIPLAITSERRRSCLALQIHFRAHSCALDR